MKDNSRGIVGLLREYVSGVVRGIMSEDAQGDSLRIVQPALAAADVYVSKFLGQGLHGLAFLDTEGNVVKVSMAKDEAQASAKVKQLEALAAAKPAAFVSIDRAGVLGPLSFPGDRWVLSTGVAFFYVMERAQPVPRAEAQLAVKLLHELLEDPNNVKKTVFVARRVMKRDGDDPAIVDKTLALFSSMQRDKVRHTDVNVDALMSRADGSYCLVDLESASLA